MFNQSFFEDIKGVIDDIFVGSEKVYILRQQAYDPDQDTMSSPTPAGGAVEAVITRVSKQLVDNELILRTDSSVVCPASRLSFTPRAADKIYFAETASGECYPIVAVAITRSPSTILLYEMVVRI